MNYESRIEKEVMEELQRCYIDDKKDLLLYLSSRFFIEKRKPGKNFLKSFLIYLFDMIGIREMTYYRQTLFLGISHENSLMNVLYQWMKEADITEKELIDEGFLYSSRALKKTALPNLKYKRYNEYDEIKKYAAILWLNKYFEVKSFSPMEKIEGFFYKNGYPIIESIESLYIREIRKNQEDLLPKEMEAIKKFFLLYPDCFEEEITITGQDVIVKNHQIDFMARDNKNNLIFILFPRDENLFLFEHMDAYQEEVKKLYQENRVRFVLFFYRRDDYVESAVHNAELYTFTPIKKLGRIKDLDIQRFFKNKEQIL